MPFISIKNLIKISAKILKKKQPKKSPQNRTSFFARKSLLGGALFLGLLGVLYFSGIFKKDKTEAPPKHLLHQAQVYADRFEFQKGIDLLQNYLKKHPRALLVHYTLGALYGKMGDDSSAAEYFKKEIALNPNHDDSYRLLGEAYQRLGFFQEALSAFQKEAQLNPHDWRPFYKSGLIFYEHLNANKKAMEALQRAVKINSSVAEPLILLGKIYFQSGDLSTAKKYFQKAIAIDSEFPEPYRYLGQIFLRQGRQEEGQRWLARFKEVSARRDRLEQLERAGTAQAAFLAGEEYFKIKKFSAAVKAFQRAIRLNPDHWRSYVGLGMVYMIQRQYGVAVSALQKAQSLAPREFDVNYRLALAYAFLKQKQKAVQAIKLAKQNRPLNKTELLAVSRIFLQNGITSEGLELLKKAQALDPDDQSVLLNLAFALHQMNRLEEARTYYERAMQLDPKNLPCKIALTMVLLTQKESGKARQYVRQMLNRYSIAEINKYYLPFQGLPGSKEFAELLSEPNN
ncbi:MAG: tetratricopeptide repeat protein [Calditrichaeota bacterium]|nr:MAG: tetratricopeptide repeat protein [Calditrichota bacterium]